MKAKIWWGKYGPRFDCATCGNELIPVAHSGASMLEHPESSGLLRRKPVDCPYKGQRFKHPFRECDLEPV